MSGIKFGKIQGLDKLKAQFEALKQLDKQRVVFAGAEVLFKATQETCPVDTGYLKSTGNVEKGGDGAVVSYDADYAIYVEYKTSPFIRPALDNNLDKISKAAGNELEKVIKETV